MSSPESAQAKKPWYTTPWGVIAGTLILALLAGLAYIGVKTISYYRQIRLGEIPPELSRRFTRGDQPAPSGARADLALSASALDNPSFGAPQSPLTVVEFADFECPFSREASFIIRELQANYPDKIRYIYRDFPLPEIHPHAQRAAEAARCAHDQGAFWAMHDKLYQNSQRLTDLDIKTYALEIGLNLVEFNNCFDGRKYKDEIEIDRADGIAAGVVGTPTFFINGQKIEGAIPMELWEQILARVK